MSEKTQANDREVGRFYTSARSFKQVLGSLPDGTKIPGGPYTHSQIGTMVGILIVGWIARDIWSIGSVVGDFIALIAIAVGAGYLIGQMPSSRRNPLKLLSSALTLVTHPGPGGRWRGRPLRLTTKAQKIQRETKKAAKAAASKATSETPEAPEEPPAELGYGSSLHRLIGASSERKS